jgi:flagella basal body P-ring formation protein FlgA
MRTRSAATKNIFHLALVLLALDSFASGVVKISFRPSVLTRSASLTLGEILQTEGLPSDVKKELDELSLGTAPKFGERRTFSDRGLSTLLRYHLGLKEKELGRDFLSTALISIPREVVVEGAGLDLAEDSLRRKVVERAKELCPTCRVEVLKVDVGPMRPYPPSATWDLSLRENKIQNQLSGQILVQDESIPVDRIPIQTELRIFKRVPVLQRGLQMGELITTADVSWTERNLASVNSGSAVPAEMLNARTRRALPAGYVITGNDIQRELTVKRGETVEVHVRNADWNVSMKGVAEDSGRIGDAVRVRNPVTQKRVSAVVIQPGVVEIR